MWVNIGTNKTWRDPQVFGVYATPFSIFQIGSKWTVIIFSEFILSSDQLTIRIAQYFLKD